MNLNDKSLSFGTMLEHVLRKIVGIGPSQISPLAGMAAIFQNGHQFASTQLCLLHCIGVLETWKNNY